MLIQVITVPLIQQLAVALIPHIKVRHLKVIAPARSRAALEVTRMLDLRLAGAADPPPGHILHLEFGRVAVLAGVAGVVFALPRVKGLVSHTNELDVLHDDVLGVAEAAASAVGWVAARDARPSLEIGGVRGIDERDVARVKVLNVFKLAVVLAHGADGDALPVLENAIVDGDVARVHLESDGVVAVCHKPSAERDAVRVYRIAPVSVERVPLAVRRAVDVNIVKVDVL